jgi:hypothetical protein
MPHAKDDDSLLGLAAASRRLAEYGEELSPTGLKYAADRGEIKCLRTADRGVRLFTPAWLRDFAKARQAK